MNTPEHGVDPTLRRDYRDLFRRTWEIELIISGAVLFALLQVPPVVSDTYARIYPRTADVLAMSVFMAYYYLKLALYTLIIAFILHLAGRAYWIGLIGLDSVFPNGIRWDELRLGVLMRRVYESRLPTLDELIERTDRLCSVIFSLAFSIVLTFAASVVIAAACAGIGFMLARIMPGVVRPVPAFWALYVVVFIAPSLLAGFDRKYGERWGRRPGVAGAVTRIFRAYVAITLARWYAPINFTVLSNVPRRTGLTIGIAALTGLILLFFVNDLLLGSERVMLDSYALLPAAAGELHVDPAYYVDQRRSDRVYEDVPSIQSEVIEGRYIRLFVPIPARRLEAIRADACPDVPAVGDDGLRLQSRNPAPPDTAAIRRVLACLAGVFPVTLDGLPLGVEYRIHTDPTTGLRGLLARIPADTLEAGAHALSVPRVPRERDLRAGRVAPPHVIPFWL